MLEILGTRLIGPFYGVSLYVWSSLISVTLVSLAVGYFLGGRLADRGRVDLSVILVGTIASDEYIGHSSDPSCRKTQHSPT